MTSTFAEVVLGLFIPFAIGMFFMMRPLAALLVAVLGAAMFLPVGPFFKLPYFAELSKSNLPCVCALIGCLLACPRRFKKLPGNRTMLFLALVAVAAGAITGMTNGDVLTYGDAGQVVKPGLGIKDGLYITAASFFPPLATFYLGYALVRDANDIDRLLLGFAVAGLLYCPFAMVEMRMSPQFHYWIYGYDTGAFGETVRWGGYRPKVFMDHGLTLARFFMATLLALFVVAKRRRTLWGLPTKLLAWFHLVVFVLCRSTGAIALGLVGYFFISFVRPKRQLAFAAALSLATLLYPLLRASPLFPTESILQQTSSLSSDRSESLAFRFRNEEMLLVHARERLLFGWGTYGRNRVFSAEGRDLSVTDGQWIIVLGISGLTGYLLVFGTLTWPCIWARRRLAKRGTSVDKAQLAGLAVIVALSTLDLIPNGMWDMVQCLPAGALMRGLVMVQPESQTSAEDEAGSPHAAVPA